MTSAICLHNLPLDHLTLGIKFGNSAFSFEFIRTKKCNFFFQCIDGLAAQTYLVRVATWGETPTVPLPQLVFHFRTSEALSKRKKKKRKTKIEFFDFSIKYQIFKNSIQ